MLRIHTIRRLVQLTDRDYHKFADETMNRLLESFEDLGESLNVPGYDVTYSSGVLKLDLGLKGSYVINKQPPNKQIWLSSPISGPKRYDYVNGKWIYSREKSQLETLLSSELSQLLSVPIAIK